MGADNAMFATAMTQYRRARAVAEQHASVAIRPIRDRGQFLGADYQYYVVRVRCDELLRDFDSEKKTRARGGNIETGGLFRADFFLHETGRGGEKHIGRGRRDQDKF